MRGYHAMVLVDVSEQGGEPGDVYVIEPDPSTIKPIEDGEPISPHGMDPQTVLRFVKTVHGWPGKVVVVGCEPADVESLGMELSEPVESARWRRRPGWCSRSSTSFNRMRRTRRASHA